MEWFRNDVVDDRVRQSPATLAASLIFGAPYQFAGPLMAFGWGAALGIVAVILMLEVKEARVPTPVAD